MLNFSDIINNYVLLDILFYLDDKKLLTNLIYNWLDKKIINNDIILKGVFDFLQFKNLIFLKDSKYFFEKNFNDILIKSWYAKFLIFSGYKYKFNFIWNSNNFKKDNRKVAEGSFLVQRKIYESFFIEYLNTNKIKSFLDIWCWNWNLVILLAEKFKNIKFYWIDIDKNSCDEAKDKIKKLNLNNIEIINEDIFNIKNINIWNVDLVTWFFVFHEFIWNDIEKLLTNIFLIFSPKILLLKEFTPPNSKIDIKNDNIDSFYITYNFIHNLTNQKTFSIREWESLLLSYWFMISNIYHTEKYDNNLSLYPLLEFKKK